MDTAAGLSRLLGPLRRAVLRSVRTAAGLPDLPEAQIELLRVLVADGPLSPREVAARLHIAPPTVSNLVKTLAVAGLVDRSPAPGNLRTVRLSATSAASELLGRYDRTSRAALSQAIDELSDQDRAALEAALPVLAKLTTSLEGSA